MVELALVVGVLLVMALSLFDIGRAAQAYLAIIQGARDGARVAMTTGASDTQITAAAMAAADPFNPSVSVTRGTTVTVTLRYSYAPITPFLTLIGSGSTIEMQSRMVSQ